MMANVKLVHLADGSSFVRITSPDGKNISGMSRELWDDIKHEFGIDEDTVDAYDYVKRYDALWDVGSRVLVDSPVGSI
jgi:RNAse (barnase) inhibitor barstar